MIERTFPDGLDIEIFTAETLATAMRDCKDPWAREHVTPYMRTGSGLNIETGNFKVGHFKYETNFAHLRWTLDTATDYEFFLALFEHNVADLPWLDIVSLLTRNSELLTWNRAISKRQISFAEEQKNIAKPTFQRSVQHLSRALRSIPIGSQTFSKSYLGWTMGHAPTYAEAGSGAILTDIDGNKYITMMALPVVLGYADPFDAMVVKQLSRH